MGYGSSKPRISENEPESVREEITASAEIGVKSADEPKGRPAQKKKQFNPFYAALIIIGVIFAVTATGYGVMTVKKLNIDRVDQAAAEGGINGFLDRYGFATMMIELGCLAVVTVAAMILDEARDRRAANGRASE